MKKKIAIILMLLGMALPSHAMTYAQILTEIRLHIKDSDTTRQRYTDTQLLNMVSAAGRDMAIIAHPVLIQSTVTLISGTTCYDISGTASAGYLDVKRGAFLSSSGESMLPETTVEQLNATVGDSWRAQAGVPQSYYFEDTRLSNVCVYPWPNGVAGSTGTLTLDIYTGIGVVTDVSQDPFGTLSLRFTNYHDLFVWYVCADVYMIEGDADKVTFYRGLYDNRLKVLKDQIYNKENYNPGLTGQRQ